MDCHFDQRDDCMDRYIAPCNICIHHFHVAYAGGRAMHGAIAEESYLVAKDKISPVVEMTRACHSDQRDDCMDTGGRAMQELLPRNLAL